MNAKRKHKRQADVHSRARMVWLWLAGLSVREISFHMHVSITTVYRWVRRWQEEGSVETRPYTRISPSYLRRLNQRNRNIPYSGNTPRSLLCCPWKIDNFILHTKYVEQTYTTQDENQMYAFNVPQSKNYMYC